MEKIILASGSPRRKQLLELAEIPFEVMVSSTDEKYPLDLSPADTVLYIAENKAITVKKKLNLKDDSDGYTIIAADTVVVLKDEIIGKPKDREMAISILSNLSGNIHTVITGVCIVCGKEKVLFSEETEVEFYPLSVSQIEFYVDKYKPYDKAGAYAIQEWIGAVGVKSIRGDFYNVMGLPVSRVVQELNRIISVTK
ncbi:MAG: Maf family protein [Ginsengibacter sp.]